MKFIEMNFKIYIIILQYLKKKYMYEHFLKL